MATVDNTPRIDAVWKAVREGSFRLADPMAKAQPSVSDAFGLGMAKHLHLRHGPMIGIQNPQKIRLAVTRLTSDRAMPDRTVPFRPEPFFTVQLYLRPTSGAKLWHANQLQPVDPNRYEGSVTTHDFEREPSVYLGSAYDILQFYIPREALDEFADQSERRRCETLSWPTGKVDPAFRSLAESILPAFAQPELSSRIYLDYLILSAHAYIAEHYVGISAPLERTVTGLAPWQRKRAIEVLSANLDGGVSLQEVARECHLSPSHFAHAFKRSFGKPPHRWLSELRIAVAKNLLLESTLPVVDVAFRAGYSDQTAFNRAFKRFTNTSPSQWCRNRHRGTVS